MKDKAAIPKVTHKKVGAVRYDLHVQGRDGALTLRLESFNGWYGGTPPWYEYGKKYHLMPFAGDPRTTEPIASFRTIKEAKDFVAAMAMYADGQSLSLSEEPWRPKNPAKELVRQRGERILRQMRERPRQREAAERVRRYLELRESSGMRGKELISFGTVEGEAGTVPLVVEDLRLLVEAVLGDK